MSEVIEGRFKPLVITADAPGVEKSVYAEAHEKLREFEAMFKDSPPRRIIIVADADQLAIGPCGEKCRPSDAAGLLVAGAHLILADGLT